MSGAHRFYGYPDSPQHPGCIACGDAPICPLHPDTVRHQSFLYSMDYVSGCSLHCIAVRKDQCHACLTVLSKRKSCNVCCSCCQPVHIPVLVSLALSFGTSLDPSGITGGLRDFRISLSVALCVLPKALHGALQASSAWTIARGANHQTASGGCSTAQGSVSANRASRSPRRCVLQMQQTRSP